ncbi:MAG: ABC transporter permease, partial [Roseovarius confluentis]
MNFLAIAAIYKFEMQRFFRTLLQSFVSPVISTSLYFVVFGAAIGSRIDQVEGVSYGAFIVPGLIMLSVITQAISNASFGIYFPKFIGTIYELLSAPVNFLEIVIGYVGAAATKALFIGVVILATSALFVDVEIQHPGAMVVFLLLTCISFALFGFIIGIWAQNFEQLQLVPLLIVTPLVFLGGSFYSISMLPPDQEQAQRREPRNRQQAQPDGHVRLPEESPAEPRDQVDHRVEQRHRLPERRQHRDRVERA